MVSSRSRPLEGRFRIVVLILATGCLSMMLANILTLNFTILCMTEGKFRWEELTLDLGIDVFERVDFERRKPKEVPDVPESAQRPDYPQTRFPLDVEIPGIRVPSPGFNWQSFRLARQNPQLFLRLMKTIIVEVSERTASRLGEKFDPRNIDFNRFRNGFNLTDINEDVVERVKEYILRKVQYARANYEVFDAEGRNISQWRNVTLQDLELHNITWNGVVKGRVRVFSTAPDHAYNASQKALLFAIVAVGALLAIAFISFSINRFGCRKTFTVVGCISTIATALCPLAASLGFFPFVVVRCIQGVGFAACFPVIGCITASWAKLSENGLFNGALTSFIQLAPVITMPISGILCSTSLGWPTVYYLHAFFTAVLMALWWIIYRDSPSESNYVNITELRKLQSGKVIDGRKRHNRVKFPLKEICTNVSVWAIWIAAVGNMYAIQMLILFSPTYIREILHYTIMNVGFAAALPTLCQFCVKMFAGMLSDRINLGETCKVRIFNSIAFLGMATFLIALALVPTDWHVLALVLLVLSVTVLGFNTGGFFKSATLVGRQYAYFVNTNVQIIMCIAMLTVPFLVYSLTPNHTAAEWSNVFILHAIFLIVCNGIFCLLGSGLPAPFTQVSPDGAVLKDKSRPIIVKDGAKEEPLETTKLSVENGTEEPAAGS